MRRAHTAWIAAGLAAIFIGTPARSRPTLDSWDWATVGDPGNRGTTDDENGIYFTDQTVIGGVDSRYRMAVTEVTVGQYIGFAQDYASLYRERTGNFGGFSDFTGGDFILQGGNATARINPGVSANQPIQVGWEYAARFTNWLHNGGGTEARVFDRGVYDTSTFTQNPDGSWNHTLSHDADASVHMATLDEWTKAGYWDPNKNGGEGGYWRYNHGSDDPTEPYTERNTGDPDGESNEPLDVGSYPEVQSPWGILDMAGGAREWTETAGSQRHSRWLAGSNWTFDNPNPPDPYLLTDDALGHWPAGSVLTRRGGIRLVRPIPAPPTVGIISLFPIITRRVRRKSSSIA